MQWKLFFKKEPNRNARDKRYEINKEFKLVDSIICLLYPYWFSVNLLYQLLREELLKSPTVILGLSFSQLFQFCFGFYKLCLRMLTHLGLLYLLKLTLFIITKYPSSVLVIIFLQSSLPDINTATLALFWLV